MDLLVAELDRLEERIDQHLNTCRRGGGESEIVGGGYAVDDGPRLVAAGDRADDGSVVGYSRAESQVFLRGRS